jgi:hypothetical protein
MVLAGGDPRGIEPATDRGALPGIAELGVGAVRLRPTGRGVCAGQGGLLRQPRPHYLASSRQHGDESGAQGGGWPQAGGEVVGWATLLRGLACGRCCLG